MEFFKLFKNDKQSFKKRIYAAFCFIASVAFLIFLSSTTHASPKCRVQKFKSYQIQYCFYDGKGPLLVLEAPLGSDLSIWPKSFLQKLNKSAAILVYNRIGYEKSRFYQSKIEQAVTARLVAKHLHTLLSHLKIEKKVILVGHSIGGLYMQYFVRNYPKNIGGIVLIDSSSSFEPKINSPFRTRALIEKYSTPYFEMLGYNQSIEQIEASPKFPNIPLLVITATNHEMNKGTEAWWQDLQKKIVNQSSKGEQIIAYGKGHFVYNEAPDLVTNAIQSFIQSHNIT